MENGEVAMERHVVMNAVSDAVDVTQSACGVSCDVDYDEEMEEEKEKTALWAMTKARAYTQASRVESHGRYDVG